MNATARLKFPQRLTGGGVKREEIAFIGSAEDQTSGGGEDASGGGRVQTKLPFFVTCRRVEGANSSPALVDRQLVFAATREHGADFELRFALEVDAADFTRRNVEQLRKRTVGRTEPD